MSRQSGPDIDHDLTAICSLRVPYLGADEWRCWGLESMIVAQHFSRHKNVPTTRRARPFTCWSCISGPLLWLSTKSVQKAVQVPFTLTEAHLGNYWGRMLAFFFGSKSHSSSCASQGFVSSYKFNVRTCMSQPGCIIVESEPSPRSLGKLRWTFIL